MPNNLFIKEKINKIGRELAYLDKMSKYTMEQIVSNFTLQAAFERFLERIITRAVDINEHIIEETASGETQAPKSYKETFFCLEKLNILSSDLVKRLIKSVNTRHNLVHDYDELQIGSIYSSVKECLKDFHEYCDSILKFTEKNI